MSKLNRFIRFTSYPDDGIYHDLFFGRDNEIREILRSVYHGGACVIYGASGIGKTSLINCGLKREIRAKKPMWPIRISLRQFLSEYRLNDKKTIDELIKSAVNDDANAHKLILEKSHALMKLEKTDNQYIHIADWLNNITITRVHGDKSELALTIIFDQFESLYELKESRAKIILNKILEVKNPGLNTNLYKKQFEYSALKEPSIIISITEPELGKLEYLTSRSAAIRNNQYRIKGLTKQSAELIIKEISTYNKNKDKFEKPPFIVDSTLLNRILEHSKETQTEKYSPFFLQLYGSWIESTVKPNKTNKIININPDKFPNNEFKDNLYDYYKESISEIGENDKNFVKNEIQAKKICEEKLLVNGNPIVVDKTKLQDLFDKEVIEDLIHKRIILEFNLDGQEIKVVRLSHSRLAEAVNRNLEFKKLDTELSQNIEIKRNEFIKIKKENILAQKDRRRIDIVKKTSILLAIIASIIFTILLYQVYTSQIENQSLIDSKNELIEDKKTLDDSLVQTKSDIRKLATGTEFFVGISKSSNELIDNANSTYDVLNNLIITLNEFAIAKIKSEKIPLAFEYLEKSSSILTEIKKTSTGLKNIIYTDRKIDAEYKDKPKLLLDIRNKEFEDKSLSINSNILKLDEIVKLSKDFFSLISERKTRSQSSKQINDTIEMGNDDSLSAISYIKSSCQDQQDLFCTKLYSQSSTFFKNYKFSNNKEKNIFVLYDINNNYLFWGENTSNSKSILKYTKLSNISRTINSLSIHPFFKEKKLVTTLGTKSGDLINLSLDLNTHTFEVKRWINLGGSINFVMTTEVNNNTTLLVSKGEEVQIREPDSLMLLGSLITDSKIINNIIPTTSEIILQYIDKSDTSKDPITYIFNKPKHLPKLINLTCTKEKDGEGIGKITAIAISPNLEQIIIGGKNSSEIEVIDFHKGETNVKDTNCISHSKNTPSYWLYPNQVTVEKILFHPNLNNTNTQSYSIVGSAIGRVNVGKVNEKDKKFAFFKTTNSTINNKFVFGSACSDSLLFHDANINTHSSNSIFYNNKQLFISTFKPSILQINKGAPSYTKCIGEPSNHYEYITKNKNNFVSVIVTDTREYIAVRDYQQNLGNYKSCIWAGNFDDIFENNNLCDASNVENNILYDFVDKTTKVNWLDINAHKNRLASVTNTGDIVVLDLENQFKGNKKLKTKLAKIKNKIWKVKFFYPRGETNIELIATADETGEIAFWGVLNDKLIKVFALQVPVLGYEYSNPIKDTYKILQDMDIRCKDKRCILAVPIMNSINITNQKVYIWEFEMPPLDVDDKSGII